MKPTRLQFFGAALNVTGSCCLVEYDSKRVLVDCGLYQERPLRSRNWDPFPFEPSSIDAVLLTHAHLDHCGLLPRLVRAGFDGPVLCSPATAEIAKIVMLDSAHIQEEDVAKKKRRHEKEGRKGPYPLIPLYTNEDVERTLPMFRTTAYERPVDLGPGWDAAFYEGGHILGSTMIRFSMHDGEQQRTLVFSGDIGRCHMPIQRDPTFFKQADYVVVESTYGDRTHADAGSIPEALAEVINRTHSAGGNVVIPSFAIERTQDLLYYLTELLAEDRIPHLLVFVDSPMAIRVTEVFRRHPELFDEETRALLRDGRHPCDFAGLTLSRSVAQSKAINHIKGSIIVIAGAGMCTGGRIKHHLAHNIERPESTLLFIGYQAYGTLGRHILEKPEQVRIFGQYHDLRAHVTKISGFSAHADSSELMTWIQALDRPPRHVIVNHGEEDAARAFAATVKEKLSCQVHAPAYCEEVVLS